MSKVIQCQTLDGRPIAFIDEVIGSGAMKDVYFSPDKSYVVCFFSKEKTIFISLMLNWNDRKIG
jgi:hypothetical protein